MSTWLDDGVLRYLDNHYIIISGWVCEGVPLNQWIKRTILSNVGGIIQSVRGLDTVKNEKKGKVALFV